MTTLDRHQMVRQVESSLKRLQTDYIDLYQTHWPDHGMMHEETLSALTDLKKAGKIRLAGTSNETSWGPGRDFVLRSSPSGSDGDGSKQFQFDQPALQRTGSNLPSGAS